MIELSGDGDVAAADDLLSQVMAVGSPRRCCCMAPTKAVGLYWNTQDGAACRPASASRTRCGCRTVRQRRETGNWYPPRWRCSVGRCGEREVGVVETRDDHTADQAGLSVTRGERRCQSPGGTTSWGCSLAMMSAPADSLWHGPVRFRPRAEADCRSDTAVLGAAHRMPRRLLTGHQQEQDGGSRTPAARRSPAAARIAARSIHCARSPCTAALGMRGQVEPARPCGEVRSSRYPRDSVSDTPH